jgi:hypothetical protein
MPSDSSQIWLRETRLRCHHFRVCQRTDDGKAHGAESLANTSFAKRLSGSIVVMEDKAASPSGAVATASTEKGQRPGPRLLKWSSLRPDEQEVLRECSVRAAVRGTGGVLLSAALSSLLLYGLPWRGSGSRTLFRVDWRAGIPSWLRFTSVVAVSCAGGYGAALSAVPGCVQRILELPNSRLAAEVRLGLEDWQSPRSRQRLDLKPLDLDTERKSGPTDEAVPPSGDTDAAQTRF